MKKFCFFTAALLTAGIMTAQYSVTGLPGRERMPQKTNVTEAPMRVASTQFTGLATPAREVHKTNLTMTDRFEAPVRTAPKGAVPENLIGKSYNTFFQSFTSQGSCVGYFTVMQGEGENNVILKGLADGYDVKGVYNKAAGTITCAANQVIGNLTNYGDITFYSLSGTQYSKTEPVVITFTDNKATFNTGIYAGLPNNAGGVAFMSGITGIESNGRLKLDQTNQTGTVQASHDLPIYITKVSDTKIEVQGLQSWLYGHNYKVPFTISGSKATLLTTDSLDYYNSTTKGKQCFFMLSFNGTNIAADPTFTVTKNDGITTLTADSRLFCGFNTSGTQWSGFFLANYTFSDTASSQGGGEDPQPDLIGKSYNTFFQSFTSQGSCVGYFTVMQGEGENNVILKGLADGYDVKGVYNKAAGTITCAANQVIGNLTNYGDITFYSLSGTQYSKTEPVVITIKDGKATFNTGIYAGLPNNAGGVAFMSGITGIESNGRLKLDQTNQTGTVQASHDLPIYITKVSDTKIEVQGLQSWLYGHNYKVPFTISGSKATLLTTDSLDYYNSTTKGKQCFFMLSFNGTNIAADPTFTVTKNDGITTLTADSRLFCGFNTSGTQWSGFFLANYTFSDTASSQGGNEDPTEATVDNINYSLDNEKLEATVTGCSQTLTALNIPNTIKVGSKTFNVVAVAKAAFQANRTITSATMPKSLKVLGYDAFRNMSNLSELRIEDLTAWCNVWIANGNANPIYNVFPTSQSKWGKIYINGQLVNTSVEVPEGVTRLGRTFYGFKTLTSAKLPSTLKTLGDQTFANCINLLTVNIPASVDSLGSAFWSCEKLDNVDVPRSVKVLGGSTFYGCKALKKVTLHTGLESIAGMAFTQCTSLETIELPSTVNSVSLTSFMGCSALKSFTCNAVTPPTTVDDAFSDFATTCTLYVPENSIPAYKAAAGWKAFSTIVKITEGVDGIDNVDEGPVQYYDLNGYKVNGENLPAGIYIRIQGGKATRVLVK